MAEARGDHPIIDQAHRIADEVLFPAANEVDQTGVVPPEHWDLLAREGFYGLAGSTTASGLDFAGIAEVLEALAGGCLSTTFTWMQHNGAVMSVQATDNAPLREEYLDGLVAGSVRAGVAFAGALPTPPRLWATKVPEGYVLDGEAPFVSGWGVVDVLQVSARDRAAEAEGGVIVSGLIDARAGEHLSVDELRLVAGQGTNTVGLHFDAYLLPTERITGSAPLGRFQALQSFGSRLNGCVACGIARRAIRLLDERGRTEAARSLRGQLERVRSDLDRGLVDATTLPASRAAAADVALRAAGALVAATGSSAVLAGQTAQRLLREACFALVAASRPDMRSELESLLAR
ncbi:acyl-CoA/acyl-ACP dehydrogenase [Tsukamurella sp. 8F]|uniref:acyl-CoA dehydrogenase family protein n=1 Tax=unclassified Tsukamurella TaxID=2633480 RepID=UPI0023B97A68|nr:MULTISPECIES: acyl-CoA dehydrogenase family protein [unclassified Tsukamurella]MDF0530124.1 acyl-CoA/acyl-ACP dehydrogenase [Tsukamurella sp. 8J]MDF0586442.1 acyl-CoA/acyl-ACP dehydrogenase [Tsukamurella sp. 8F]